MTPRELDDTLRFLGLGPVDAARLLRVTPRSIHRWCQKGVPGPATQALMAWRQLKQQGMTWRPGALPLDAFADIEAIVARVNQRGGPASPWAVDLERLEAVLGPVLITFGRSSADWWPISYERSDARPDLDRDRLIIQDGICRIALNLAKPARSRPAA